MRISDWSSDVCSSDLNQNMGDIADRSSRLFLRLASYSANGEIVAAVGALNDRLHRTRMLELEVFADAADELSALETMARGRHDRRILRDLRGRPAELRVGQEWIRTCRIRWCTDIKK